MLKPNKLLMIFFFCIVILNGIYTSIQTSDEGDTLGLVNIFFMVLLIATAAFYFIRREKSKEYGKCCINHNIDRNRNLIKYITL